MGNCRSSTAVAVVSVSHTAKLILPDGQLEEFSSSVKVSELTTLKKLSFPCFICDSDEMEFEEFVSAMEADQLLLPGQLYFALPLSWLSRPLQAEEIAGLAYKASLVLESNNKRLGRKVTDNSWLMSSDHHRRRRTEVSSRPGIQISSNVIRVGMKLSIIPEDDDQEVE
ncbi:uncharacterized protein LOC124930385 [Impatiens glandulifera]|uniref:uncharacterized protein LOC124930385 n=1 Tax=Impatiens glandulifera TaxID=253017 RepID=UPI001FB068F2|nr:uncharacterized protein LOC124930385 [Impatiens glandulifera]